MKRLRLLFGVLGVAVAGALAGVLASASGGGTVLGDVTEDLCQPNVTMDGRVLFLVSSGPTNPGPPFRTDPNTTGDFTCFYEGNGRATRITFTYRREKRAVGSRFCDKPGPLGDLNAEPPHPLAGYLNSANHDIQVHVALGVGDDRGKTVREDALADAEAQNIGWPCEDKAPPDTSPPPVTSPPPAVTTKEIPVPAPGKTTKAKFPVGATTTEGTVTVSGDGVEGIGVAFNEKAKRLNKLKGIQQRLTTDCYAALLAAIHVDVGDEAVFVDLGLPPRTAGLALACTKLLAEIQQRIDDLERPRVAQTLVVPECAVAEIGLRLTKKAGKPAVVKIAKKVKPRLDLSCEVTAAGLELTISRRGKGTLRQALGKNLVLTFRRSDAAPPPDPGATLEISFSQR